MTAKQMSIAIGARVEYLAGDLSFACIVTDAKSSYGTARVQIKPVTGSGLMWVNLSSVRIPDANKPWYTDAHHNLGQVTK